MKKLIFLAVAIAAMSLQSTGLDAQILIKKGCYKEGGMDLFYNLGCTGKNRQNANYYRMRENLAEDLKPGKYAEEYGLECIIAEQNEDGTYMALWRTPMASDSPWKDYVVTLYNKKKKVQKEINVSDLAGFEDCEVQDVRYKDGLIYFNMAYITYSSQVNGQCSKLYCLDPKTMEQEWCTPYLCSNGIFIIEGDYVVCGYGFTNEDDFVYLISRKDGAVFCEMPVKSSPVNYEFDEDGDLIVVDYNDNVYAFGLADEGVKVTGKGVRMRLEPSLEGEIFCEYTEGRPTYATKGDILQYLGEEGDFYKVLFDFTEVYISKQFSEIVKRFN